ncbi:Transglutaminase-like enzyme, putative cysteine protease [Flavobacteriaceae bacterium MAR_2010_188]|nr:Transglutaminase-like enzyme, putative cysteine protease [Flavobacteriaceae bacterium MAR_2010_188]
MNNYYSYRIVMLTLIIIGVVSLCTKLISSFQYFDRFYADEIYNISYRYFYQANEEGASVTSYLPKSNNHQRITSVNDNTNTKVQFVQFEDGRNLKGSWVSSVKDKYEDINYNFTFEGKTITYKIPLNFQKPTKEYRPYLRFSDNVQGGDSHIQDFAKKLAAKADNDRERIKNIYKYVENMPAAPAISLKDASAAFEQNKASSNCKSRLLVAFARSLGYPARVRSGLMLDESNTHETHSWSEININDTWIPFDASNDQYARLPSNYLELYEGDDFMAIDFTGSNFDYAYEINKQVNLPYLKISANEFRQKFPISLWGLVENNIINLKMLTLLLMIPIGGLIVAFLRNIVGLKTFGVFLPVLISFSLIEIGFVKGLFSFIVLILIVGLVTRPFNKMKLLHTPKLVISLTLMILVMLAGSYLGMETKLLWLTSLSFFPVIILTISAERFSTLIEEHGLKDATITFGQTLISVVICYLVLYKSLVSYVLILYPEILLLVIALAMLLGRYIGLRWTELIRFKPLLNFNK